MYFPDGYRQMIWSDGRKLVKPIKSVRSHLTPDTLRENWKSTIEPQTGTYFLSNLRKAGQRHIRSYTLLSESQLGLDTGRFILCVLEKVRPQIERGRWHQMLHRSMMTRYNSWISKILIWLSRSVWYVSEKVLTRGTQLYLRKYVEAINYLFLSTEMSPTVKWYVSNSVKSWFDYYEVFCITHRSVYCNRNYSLKQNRTILR